MASEVELARYRRRYRHLLRRYPQRYRERFAVGMEQTFADLCRERAVAGQGLFGFALRTLAETSVAIINEHVIAFRGGAMGSDSMRLVKLVKHLAIALGVLMLAGIATVMVLARGTGEDLAGVVAPALLIALISVIVASAAAVRQRRAVDATRSARTEGRADS